MTSNSRPTDRRNRFRSVWTYAQARAVLPYVAAIMGSLREYRLDFLRHRLAAKRSGRQARQAQAGYTARPGRGCSSGRPSRCGIPENPRGAEFARHPLPRLRRRPGHLHRLREWVLEGVRLRPVRLAAFTFP